MSSARPEPKKLGTSDVSSIFDLQNELIKKRSQVANKKPAVTGEYAIHGNKGGVLTVKKEERRKLSTEAQERKRKIAEYERALRAEEEERIAKSTAKMKEKTELYEKLKDGDIVLTHKDEVPVQFMVDFQLKNKMYQEEADQRAGISKAQNVRDDEPGPSSSNKNDVIYHFNPDEERREYGPSHIKLAQEEEKRQQQIKELYELSDKTATERAKRQEVLKKREEAKRQKTNALRRRLGLPEEKEPQPEPEPVYLDIPLPKEETVEERFAKRIKSDREWDRGKGSYNQWITKQREEREEEFAPPSFY